MTAIAATIGFFDGVHRGHRFLIDRVIREAKARGMVSAVITFDRHPREVLHSSYRPRLLTTLDEKLLLLSQTGIDRRVVLPFTPSLSDLSARQFMLMLREKMDVRLLVIGYDNRFGHGRLEGFADYERYGGELGIDIVRSEAFSTCEGVRVSSSVIRRYIERGEMDMARECLGYPYTLPGTVVSGEHIGSSLGFPTANIDAKEWSERVVPLPGVYAVKARLLHEMVWRHAIMNIGTRPTFDGRRLTLETYIFRFDDDIYGEKILIAFVRRLRAERRFTDSVALASQLRRDALSAERLFEKGKEE